MIKDANDRARVRIVSAAGTEVVPGIIAADPEVAKPHADKLGWMTEEPADALGGRTNPRIELDDGGILWGYECWWDYYNEEG